VTQDAAARAGRLREIVVGSRSLGDGWLRRAAYPAIIGLAVIALALMRHPELVTVPEFTNEDGQVFFLGAHFGAGPWTPYNGYLHAVPRLVGWLELLVPVVLAPMVSNLAALVGLALIGGFIASDQMSGAIPSRGARTALAVSLPLLPGSGELAGTLWGLQWYGCVFLVAAAFARPSRWLLVPITVAGLTGPFSLIVWPIFLARARDSQALAVIGCVVLQGSALLVSERFAARGAVDPLIMGQVLALRGAESVLSPSLLAAFQETSLLIPMLATLAVALVAAARAVPRSALIAIAYVVIAVAIAGVVAAPNRGDQLLAPGTGARYFLPVAVMIVVVALAAIGSRHPAYRAYGGILGMVVVIGMRHTFQVEPRPVEGWADLAPMCIGSTEPCAVPVYPPDTWTLRWPGAAGTYSARPIGW
jgi:hypothetical protein